MSEQYFCIDNEIYTRQEVKELVKKMKAWLDKLEEKGEDKS